MSREWFSLEEISARGLCMSLLRNMWMILLTAAALWLAATGWNNLTYQPEYTSQSTLVVTAKGGTNAYSSLSLTTQMADVFAQVFQSDVLAEKIAEDTGESINGRISCAQVAETNLLVLGVTCRHPREAYVYINAALKHYEEVSGEVFANASLQILQEPEVPLLPSNTSFAIRYRYWLMAAGAVSMALLVGLLYAFRFTVKNPLCAQRQLDGKIRGVIPFERKKRQSGQKKNPKRALLLNSPVMSMDFVEAGRKAEANVESHLKHHGKKTLLVTSIAENEGKSTVAANLALALAERHKRVLLVDGDLRKPGQYKIFERSRENRISLRQVLSEEKCWKDAVYYNKRDKIWELFQFHSVRNPEKMMDEAKMASLMKEWKREMDYIIIDSPPVAVSADAEIWVSVVDSALLVVREDWADVRVINDAVDMISQNETDFAGFVLSAFHKEWGQFMMWGAGERYGRYQNYDRRKAADPEPEYTVRRKRRQDDGEPDE